jgi:hypothetical protein
MVTIATVGYGNQLPSLNNVPAVIIVAMIFGQLYFAMPLAIIGNNFQRTYETFQWTKKQKVQDLDATLIAFQDQQLHHKAQRLGDIQYHMLQSWQVTHMTIGKLLRYHTNVSRAS